ncbi:MAG: cupin domain-containing protein [Pseudomonadota bacterium]
MGGQSPQIVVPAGTWMGARIEAGGTFALFGNTMAPGFRSSFYEGGVADELARRWPDAAGRIRKLTRADAEVTMPDGL